MIEPSWFLFTCTVTLNFNDERRKEEVKYIYKLFKFLTLKSECRGGKFFTLSLFSPPFLSSLTKFPEHSIRNRIFDTIRYYVIASLVQLSQQILFVKEPYIYKLNIYFSYHKFSLDLRTIYIYCSLSITNFRFDRCVALKIYDF